MLYTALWAGIGIGLIVALFLRTDIDVNVTPVRNPTFVTLSDGSIRNTYDLRLRNKHGEDRWFTISVTSDALRDPGAGRRGRPDASLVPANETMSQRVYLTAAAGTRAAAERPHRCPHLGRGQGSARAGTDRVHHDTIFNGEGGRCDDRTHRQACPRDHRLGLCA